MESTIEVEPVVAISKRVVKTKAIKKEKKIDPKGLLFVRNAKKSP
jgi:hypothetical protein